MTNELIKYDVSEAVAATLKAKLAVNIPDGIVLTFHDIPRLKEAKKEPASLRIAIEKKRVEYNEAAQKHIKDVNAKAKEAQALINPIEEAYAKEIKCIEDEIQRQAAEAQAKEAARIAVIKDKMSYYFDVGIGIGFSVKELQSELDHLLGFLIDNFDYQEFSSEAKLRFETKEAYIKTALKERLIYEDGIAQLETQRKIDAENRAKFEAEKAVFEAEKRALAAQQVMAEQRRPTNEAPKPVSADIAPTVHIDLGASGTDKTGLFVLPSTEEKEPENLSLFPDMPPPPHVFKSEDLRENPSPWNSKEIKQEYTLLDVFTEIKAAATAREIVRIFGLVDRGIALLNVGE